MSVSNLTPHNFGYNPFSDSPTLKHSYTPTEASVKETIEYFNYTGKTITVLNASGVSWEIPPRPSSMGLSGLHVVCECSYTKNAIGILRQHDEGEQRQLFLDDNMFRTHSAGHFASAFTKRKWGFVINNDDFLNQKEIYVSETNSVFSFLTMDRMSEHPMALRAAIQRICDLDASGGVGVGVLYVRGTDDDRESYWYMSPVGPERIKVISSAELEPGFWAYKTTSNGDVDFIPLTEEQIDPDSDKAFCPIYYTKREVIEGGSTAALKRRKEEKEKLDLSLKAAREKVESEIELLELKVKSEQEKFERLARQQQIDYEQQMEKMREERKSNDSKREYEERSNDRKELIETIKTVGIVITGAITIWKLLNN